MKNFQKVSLVSVLVSFGLLAQSYAFTPITSQLDLGQSGTNVTNLQTFFSANSAIYPEGLVTGYFGGLTKMAVQRFQATYGFAQVGRVGPVTLTKINQLINAGGWGGSSQSSDIYAPLFSSVNRVVTGNSVNFLWNTNENSLSKVFYNTSPITINEGDENSIGFRSTSGFIATGSNMLGSSQQVMISGLQANTTYYYVLVSTDVSGNVSVFDTNSTFRTNAQ